jgi:hypothetical protein
MDIINANWFVHYSYFFNCDLKLCRAVPCRAVPCRAVPCPAPPRPAPPRHLNPVHRSFQSISSGPRLCLWIFHNKYTISRLGVVSTSPSPQAEGPPLVGHPRLLIQYICSDPSYWRLFLHPQPEDVPCLVDICNNYPKWLPNPGLQQTTFISAYSIKL